MKRTGLFRVGGALALVLAIAACSSSTKQGSGTGGNTSGSSTAATGSPIKVGFLCSCSGSSVSYYGQVSWDVLQAWEKTVNSEGGIDGHPVEIMYEDDESIPGNAETDGQKVVSAGVAAIIDMSDYDTVWASAVEAAHIPVLGGHLTGTPFYTNPDFFASGETEDSLIYAIAETAKKAGATSLATFYCAEAPECQQSVPAVKAAAEQVGLTYAGASEISATAPNYTAQCLAAQQKHASAIFIADTSQVIPRVGANCASQGYKPIYITEGNGYGPILKDAAGIANQWAPYNDLPYFSDAPAVKTMRAAVNKYFPGLQSNANTWNSLSDLVWPAGILLEDAVKAGGLKAGGTVTASEVLQGLYALKGDTLDGWSPPLTFTKGKPTSVDCWFTGHVENGVQTVVGNGALTCEKGTSS